MQKTIKTIGWIGTGIMGKSMCKHILNSPNKYILNVFNRTKSKTDELIESGAKFMQPEEIAKSSDVIMIMVGFPKDVEDVILGKLLNNLKEGQIVVDHTTSSPQLAEKIHEILKKK